MTCQLQTVLEECRLDWHQMLKLVQGDWLHEQLMRGVTWEVGQDELTWIRHEVELIQLIADDVSIHLHVTHVTLAMTQFNKLYFSLINVYD